MKIADAQSCRDLAFLSSKGKLGWGFVVLIKLLNTLMTRFSTGQIVQTNVMLKGLYSIHQ